MRVFIIIPGYNEAKYLNTVIKKVLRVTKNIIYIDDGSLDRSPFIARKLLKHVLVHSTNLGKGAALKTGCEYAFNTLHADAVVFMDADDQHDVLDLPRFIQALHQKAQIVFGVRKFSSTMPLFRFLGNRFASILLNLLFRKYIPDIPSGYKAITKHAYPKILWKSTGYEVEMEIAVRVVKEKIPYTILEIDAIYHDADKGMTPLDAMHIARCLVQWRIHL